MTDGLFGEPRSEDMRPRTALIANPEYECWELDGQTVFTRRRALERMFHFSRYFGFESPRREVAFVCLGRREQDGCGPYAIIEALPLVAQGEPDYVMLLPEQRWAARRRFAGWDEIGYAHTHPGYGVFFSPADKRTALDYGPLSVNLLHDPVAEKLGVAVGERILLVVRTGASRVRRRLVTATPTEPRTSAAAAAITLCGLGLLCLVVALGIRTSLPGPARLPNNGSDAGVAAASHVPPAATSIAALSADPVSCCSADLADRENGVCE